MKPLKLKGFREKGWLVMHTFLRCFLLGLFALPVYSQTDSVTVLDKVVLFETELEEFSNTQHVRVLNDSVLKNSKPLLTDVLNYRTPLYFKENGRGMVSSISFRGTTASQTAVVWNGINVNSIFNGQTDFNTITLNGFDEIAVRSGGGSVLFGTGAIGGSVHLNNRFEFGKGIDHDLKVAYGSFNTLNAGYELSISSKKTNLQINLARASSDNDFPIPGSDRKNLNGQYYHQSLSAGFAYKINSKHQLKFRSSLMDGERHFSLIRPTENRTKYQNFHAWNLLEWDARFSNKLSSNLKLAFLSEEFKYFDHLENKSYSFGKAGTFVAEHNLGYVLGDGLEIHSLLEYEHTRGKGTNVPKNIRQTASAGLLLKQRVSSRFLYEVGAKIATADDYKSTWLFSAGADFQITDFYSLKLNASRNFRIPTFNDLYWYGSGNTNLKPETSLQAELGNYFRFGPLDFSLTGYLIDIDNLIRWEPAGNGVWRPKNTEKVQTYGLETLLGYRKKFGDHHFFLNATYGYTVSKNQTTGKQLIYVPYHKATANLAYRFKHWALSYTFLYTGEVFTRTDNEARYNLPGYAVSNVGLSRLFGENKAFKIGGKVLNLFNEKYQSVENRFFPGRNYTFYLIFKF